MPFKVKAIHDNKTIKKVIENSKAEVIEEVEIKKRKKKSKIVGKKQCYEYQREELLAKIKINPALKLTVGQILILFPDYTANQLKHFRSAAYQGNDAPPFDDRFGRPKYVYNQFYAWHHKENTADKTAKAEKRVKEVK